MAVNTSKCDRFLKNRPAMGRRPSAWSHQAMSTKETDTQDSFDECPWRDEQLLRELYLDRKLSLSDISERFDCAPTTVSKWLRRHDIPTRGPAGTGGVGETLKNKNCLRKEYLKKEKSIHTIANELEVAPWTVHEYLKHHGIPRRGFGLSGERNGNYRGGHDKYYGASFEGQREKALERDNHQCQDCGIGQKKHKSEYSCELHIHHVQKFSDFGVENHREANRLENLVTLCASCHRKWEGVPVRPQLK